MLYLCYIYVIFMLYLCYIYVIFMLYLCYIYVIFMLYLCYIYVIFMLYLCYIYVIFMLYLCYIYVIFMLYLCYIYVIFMLYFLAYVPRPNSTDESGEMYFDVSSNYVIEKTLATALQIYLDAAKKNITYDKLKISVYKIVVPKRKYVLLASKIINASVSQWHEFNVLEASMSWIEFPETNNGVLIICENLKKETIPIENCGIVDFKGSEEYRPFLVSFYQSGKEEEFPAERIRELESTSKLHERLRRSIQDSMFLKAAEHHNEARNKTRSNGSETNHLSRCNKHPLYIGFLDLGWSDWIIAPDGYQASYCGGDCSFPLDNNSNATNHAIIQTLVHMMYPENIPKPCCAPNKLNTLQVLFLDDRNNVVMKRYTNMIVQHCGCQ